MTTARRRRTLGAIALSAAVHAVVFTILWLQRPTLPASAEPPGPPEAVIPVLLLPRSPPPAAGARAPAPIRLHRRTQRFATEPPPIAPLHVPEKKASPTPAAPAPPSQLPPPPLTADVRRTLKLGPVGCANADALGLSRAEREACERELAAGAKETPFIPPGMSADKRAQLQEAAAARDAKTRGWEAIAIPKPYEPPDYDGEPYTSGSGESALGHHTGEGSRRGAKKLGRLPP